MGDEVKAIWSAAADLVSEQGNRVRVLVKRGDAFVEEYIPSRSRLRRTTPTAPSSVLPA